MEYSGIIESAMKKIYDNGEEYPKYLSFPIFVHKSNKKYDLFYDLDESKDERFLEKDIKYILMQNILDLTDNAFIKEKDEISKNFFSSSNKENYSLTVIEYKESFSELYTNVREFVFNNEITQEQKEELIKLVSFYLNMKDKRYIALYMQIAPSFFEWVENILK